MKKFVQGIMFRYQLVGCLLLVFQALSAQQVDSIKSSFEEYRQAILDHDGRRAAEKVSQSTLEYYQTLVDAAMESDSAEVAAMRLIDKLTILNMRKIRQQQPDFLLTGKSYFRHAVSNGWVEQTGMKEMELGEITISQDFAAAHVFRTNEETLMYFNFHFESNWKIDLTSLIFAANELLIKAMKASGLTEVEFINRMITTGKSAVNHSDLWQPLQKR